MLEPLMLRAWVRSIARLWSDGRAHNDVGDAKVTFIAGPPREFSRIWSQQSERRTDQSTGSLSRPEPVDG
jgi:hypothetical protein